MGLTAKPFGKFKSEMKKLDNRMEQKKLEYLKNKNKKSEKDIDKQ